MQRDGRWPRRTLTSAHSILHAARTNPLGPATTRLVEQTTITGNVSECRRGIKDCSSCVRYTGVPVRPKKLVLVAKMLLAYHYLKDPGHTVAAVSKLVGFPQQRLLARHTRQVFGCLPSELRKTTNAQEIVKDVVEWFWQPSAVFTRRAMAETALDKRPKSTSVSVEANASS